MDTGYWVAGAARESRFAPKPICDVARARLVCPSGSWSVEDGVTVGLLVAPEGGVEGAGKATTRSPEAR
jgi:hypothetical protein